MAKTVFLLFSPRNSTKNGLAGVSLANNRKKAKKGGLRPNHANLLALNVNAGRGHMQ
jgi:hypothetical protein